MIAAVPDDVETAESPPSSAAIRFSKVSVVGFTLTLVRSSFNTIVRVAGHGRAVTHICDPTIQIREILEVENVGSMVTIFE